MIPQLPDDPQAPFPPLVAYAAGSDGLLAWGGDLHPQRLLAAYRLGIFPWHSPGQPLLWWWPQPRTVLYPDQLHISRRLRRSLRQARYKVTADTAFTGVIEACARPENGPEETWIDTDMIAAYSEMHRLGHAHSVEVWDGDELIGGLYGISIGAAFFGESMFSKRRDSSKIAIAWLCRILLKHRFVLLDCQMPNEHLFSLGAVNIPGSVFAGLLNSATAQTDPISDWSACFFEPLSW